MLKLPNLDDRYFDAIVKQARSMIPKLYPEWTDENLHDPGITLIELFAWYAELQQYYADQVNGSIETKFLEMLGIRMQDETAAHVDVTFGPVATEMLIPQGTPVSGGGIPFELVSETHVLPLAIDRVLVQADADVVDATAASRNRGVSFHAFGAEGRKGGQLWIGFNEPLPVGIPIRLHFEVADSYPVPANPLGNSGAVVPSATMELRVYGIDQARADGSSAWQNALMIEDQTFLLTFSGLMTIQLDTPLTPTVVRGAGDRKRYWLCFELTSGRFELPPMLETIRLNTSTAIQQKTFVKELRFGHSGDDFPVIYLNEYLARYGQLEVQVFEELEDEVEGWITWNAVDDLSACGPEDRVYRVTREGLNQPVIIEFGDSITGALPPTGAGKIRVILTDSDFLTHQMLEESSGLPGQSVEVPWENVRRGTLQLQASTLHATGLRIWKDFVCVKDFHASAADDPHFLYDEENRLLRFGDDIHGLIPPVGHGPNIRVLQLICGGGTQGNITKGVIRSMDSADEILTAIPVTNQQYARGGQNAETLAEAKDRFLSGFYQNSQAVTVDDFERLALQTPGLRIARVKAIPLYKPGLRNYPAEKAPAQMTLVAVPFSDQAKPYTGDGFLQTIRNHIEPYRLLTTEIHVIPPAYFKISVHARIVVKPHFKNRQSEVIDALNSLLQPFDRHQRSGGWAFGKTVTKADLFDVFNRITGILYVQDLRMDAEGSGWQKEPSGDIRIPPHGVVYAGEHQIQLISSADL